jgi:subtilisin family serine protease
MILKYYDEHSTGEANLRHTVEAMRYAVRNGANIINYSGGGVLRSQAEEQALKFASDHHVLLVAAAGNEGLNSDFFHFYPADYDLPNILSVAAVDRQGHLLGLSNYGRGTVDVAAPGRNIYSTLPYGGHGFMSGTSQATAFVTGVAALLMAENSSYKDPQLLIQHLLNHGRKMASLSQIGKGQMLDAARALNEAREFQVSDAD